MRIRGVDHLGITVPDIESATRYFVEALGAEVLYDVLKRSEPPLEGREVESWVGVSRGTAVFAIRLLRLHEGPSIELFEYKSDARKAAALPSDFGLQHLAVYVDDIQAAAERVRDAGGFLLKGPVALPAIEGGAGNEFWYTRTPWGMTIELITYPSRSPFERDTGQRRWKPST